MNYLVAFILILSLSSTGTSSSRTFISEGQSMAPTLQHDDRFTVDMNSYQSPYVKRFDIIVFQASPDRDYVKRVIGLPGETIEYRDDVLYINNQKIDEPYLAKNKALAKDQGIPLTENFGPLTIPDDHVFVLGDNRLNSYDSRAMGPIQISKVKGKMIKKLQPKGKK